jgi:hypothetical protein
MELSQDVGFRPIIFIRFNPDSYKINDKKITSCWYINKLGIYQINKKKINEWNDRLKNLKETIEYWCNLEHKTIEIIQLYYNQLLNLKGYKEINKNSLNYFYIIKRSLCCFIFNL